MNGMAVVSAGRDTGEYTTAQVADALNVSVRTVRNYVKRKDCALGSTEYQVGLRRVRQYTRADVEAFAKAHGLPVDWSRIAQADAKAA